MTTTPKMRRRVKPVDLAWFSPFRLKGCQELAAEQTETVFKNEQKESTKNEQRLTNNTAQCLTINVMCDNRSERPEDCSLAYSVRKTSRERTLEMPAEDTQRYGNSALRCVRKVVPRHLPKLIWRLTFRGYQRRKDTVFKKRKVCQPPKAWQEITPEREINCQCTFVRCYNLLDSHRTSWGDA